jgi:hypothetical protein
MQMVPTIDNETQRVFGNEPHPSKEVRAEFIDNVVYPALPSELKLPLLRTEVIKYATQRVRVYAGP